MTQSNPLVSIVVPLYNEEESFTQLVERLTNVIDQSSFSIEVVLVDDGSTDSTAANMRAISMQDSRFQSVFLSRNFGHQMALSAGLASVRATRAVMIIDGDLQDPPEILPELLCKLDEGYDIVYAVRTERKEGVLKKMCYTLFYRILKRFANIDIPLDSGDFCLLRRTVVDILNKMPEESRFLRGMRSWVGFRQTGVKYERSSRVAGESKYSFKMLLKLAANGIFNFSEVPIRFASIAGLFSILIGVVYVIIAIWEKIFVANAPLGFTGILGVIILFSGVQLLFMGIVGEYVLRIFFQVKQRPLFIIRSRIVDGCDVVDT